MGICYDNNIKDMLSVLAIALVRFHCYHHTGGVMHNSSSLFAAGPQSTEHRAAMVQASRGLLLAVTRLLIVADVADIYKLLNATTRVSFSIVTSNGR